MARELPCLSPVLNKERNVKNPDADPNEWLDDELSDDEGYTTLRGFVLPADLRAHVRRSQSTRKAAEE